MWDGLSKEFARCGHDVTIFARAFKGQSARDTRDGVRYVRWGGYNQSTSIRRDLLRCLFYDLLATPRVPVGDVIVTNDFWMPALLPQLRPSAGRVVAGINRFPKQQFGLYSKCAAIVPVSDGVASAIKEQTPSLASKITVVPNCVDQSFLAPLARQRSTAAEGIVRLLFAGRLHPEKGLSLLAKALNLLARRGASNWECIFIGPVVEAEGGGGESYLEAIRELVVGLPVNFAAPIYDPVSLSAVFDQADVLVYPSLADTGEAMPLAPLEAMARGAVPVVSNLKAFREYLEPGVNGMVFEHHSEDAAIHLSNALWEVMKDAEKRQTMSAAARRTAERFSPEAIADRYLELFGYIKSSTLL